MKLQPQRISGNEFNMESSPSFLNSNNNTHHRSSISSSRPLEQQYGETTSSSAAATTTAAVSIGNNNHEEEVQQQRLRYISHQVKEKQVSPTSHHGLTILITGANRYVLD